MSLSLGKYDSFVVRIWSRGEDMIQGQITHVGSRETSRFKSAKQMIAFMQAHLAPQAERRIGEQTAEES